MRQTTLYRAVVLTTIALACTAQPATGPHDARGAGPSGRRADVATRPDGPPEGLARALALALRSPAFRARLKAQLDASPFREHKIQFQQFINGAERRELHAMAAATARPPGELSLLVDAAIPLELYLPVPSHRSGWRGDGRVVVATAVGDDDVPIAFDTAGNRYELSSRTPPPIPVLALVPVETDFAMRPSLMQCLDCKGGSGNGDPPPPPASPPPGLYMTRAHFVQTFESWLKGAPEFEVHMLGQNGQTDSLADYQCAGEKQSAPYYFDQNGVDWTGSVMLFTKAQLDQYRAVHPAQSLRAYVVEDDDTPCQIKTSASEFQRAVAAVDQAYQFWTAGIDSLLTWKFAKTAQNLFAALASLINTNDELVGNAVQDSVANEFHDGYNWVVKGPNNETNGWIKMEMH
ncbi:MAG TPA: hypothetical protein VLT79_12645 [Gemmatimonadales bacterium]|nr:hypothetical protein [Gemmatimonadales bacterium]